MEAKCGIPTPVSGYGLGASGPFRQEETSVEISKITGIPAHPLFVHLPIMAIPLTALLVLAYVLRPGWRRGLIYPLGALTVLTVIGTILAAGSGESLEEMLPEADEARKILQEHTELGDQTQTIVIIFGIVTIAYLGLDWLRMRRRSDDASGGLLNSLMKFIMPLGIAAVLLGGVATVWDVRTGHSGAKSVWTEEEGSTNSGSSGEEQESDKDGDDSGLSAPKPTL